MAPVIVRSKRRGLALLELAILLPFLVLLVFGMMEYGWMLFKVQQITNAARAGVRLAVLPDTTLAEVDSTVSALMGHANIQSGSYSLTLSPPDITVLDASTLITLTVQVPYENVALLDLPFVPVPSQLRASVTMAKEGP